MNDSMVSTFHGEDERDKNKRCGLRGDDERDG